MGTDMHLMVEVDQGEGWKPLMDAPAALKCPRNYAMFAILADVRNGAGRHEKVWMEEHPHTHTDEDGVDHEVMIPGYWYDIEDGGHERLVPISEPRGIPEDASPEWRANVIVWEHRSNSVDTTWLTPDEILSGDWDQILIRYGMILEADYIELQETGKTPTMHAGGAGGDGLLIVSEAEYEEGKRGEHTTLVNATWTEGPVRTSIPGFLEMVRSIVDEKADSTKVRFMLLFES